MLILVLALVLITRPKPSVPADETTYGSRLVPTRVLGLEIPQIPAHLFEVPTSDETEFFLCEGRVGREVGHVADSVGSVTALWSSCRCLSGSSEVWFS